MMEPVYNHGLLGVGIAVLMVIFAIAIGKLLQASRRPYPVPKYGHLLGCLVIEVQCEGCMAEIHKISRVGQIVAVKKGCAIWPELPYNNNDYVVCRVVQTRSDKPEELFYVSVQDGSFQLAPNSVGYFWYR
jgi:hypothetical protein